MRDFQLFLWHFVQKYSAWKYHLNFTGLPAWLFLSNFFSCRYCWRISNYRHFIFRDNRWQICNSHLWNSSIKKLISMYTFYIWIPLLWSSFRFVYVCILTPVYNIVRVSVPVLRNFHRNGKHHGNLYVSDCRCYNGN